VGLTQTNRFKAAMAGAGLSNWQSYYGEKILKRPVDDPFFGKSVTMTGNLCQESPINFIKKAKTPT